MMAGGEYRLVAMDIVPVDEGVVLEGVLDLDRRCLEQRPLAFAILAVRHNMFSIVSASSRYAVAGFEWPA